jgi:hypothetical protein
MNPPGAFSYSGDPSSSDLDAVRFLCGDTNKDAYFLSDAEIRYLLEFSAAMDSSHNEVNVPAAAGAAAESIAAQLSREVSYSADGVSVSADSLATKFYDMAGKIRTLSRRSDIIAGPDVGGILVAEVYDSSIRPLVWAVGMHDNYLAGQQDYGGTMQPPASWGWGWGAYAAVAAASAELVTQAAQTLETP